MLDPLTAIGLAGNIVAFVDFASKLVSKAREIHKAADGVLPENVDAETIAQSLILLNSKIAHQSLDSGSWQEKALQELCIGCDSVTQELLQALEKLKVRGKKTRWKSARQALKSVAGRQEVEGIAKRVANYREQLSLSFLVALSHGADLAAVVNAKSFESLEGSTKAIIASIVENRCVFVSSLAVQTKRLEEHDKKTDIQNSLILDAIVETSDSTNREHIRTRDEVVKVSEEASKLRQDMMMELIEIKTLIRATAQASGEKQQKQLREKASLVSASWVAKEIVYSHLMDEIRRISADITAPHMAQDSKELQSLRAKGLPSPNPPLVQNKVQNVYGQISQVLALNCDICDVEILAVHYHCSLCDSDNYDICELCAEVGARCRDEEHWMMKRVLINGKITVSPTGALAPKIFYASASTKSVLSSRDNMKPGLLDSPEHLKTQDPFNDAGKTTPFDTAREHVKELGFTGHLKDLPMSFLLAVANKFSQVEVSAFNLKTDSPPMFFVGAHMFPTTIWQRFEVAHKALVTPKAASLGAIANSMTLGTLRGYNRHAIRGRDFPALVPSADFASKVTGMVIFGLDHDQRRTIDMSDPFHVGSVEIILKDGTPVDVQACIYIYYGALEVLPLKEKTWSLSEFVQSSSFKSTAQSSLGEEEELEYSSSDDGKALVTSVKRLGFRGWPSELPKSVVMAISNRFTYDQVLKRSSIKSSYYRPCFSSGSSMFPAFTLSRTPGITLEEIVKLMTPATLRGYNRHAVRNRDWQALYPSEDPKARVRGTIYFGIDHTSEVLYDRKEATVEIELVDGTKMDVQANVFQWNGKQEDLVPVSEAVWSLSTLLNSPYYKMIATASEAAEHRLAFDQAFRNLKILDTLGRMESGRSSCR